MRIQVLFFGVMKDFFEGERDVIDVPAGSDVRFLLDLLRDGEPGPPRLWESIAVAVNREYAAIETELHDGDEVALLPPVSGGAHGSVARRFHAR